VVEMAALSRWYPFHIRFIEYMPIGEDRRNNSFKTVPISRIKRRLERVGKLISVERTDTDGPALRYTFEGAVGEIGFIPGMSNHFCENCNRLRLTANGYLRPCLLTDMQEDIKGPMRRGASDDELADIIIQAAARKPKEHRLASHSDQFVTGQMHMIGG
jgi:GTP 3',8-cyclase